MSGNEHFVPQLILRGFRDEARERVWLLQLPNGEIVLRSTKSIGCEMDYYGDAVDNRLKPFENSVGKLFVKLRSGVLPKDIPSRERLDLIDFLAYQILRTPAMRAKFLGLHMRAANRAREASRRLTREQFKEAGSRGDLGRVEGVPEDHWGWFYDYLTDPVKLGWLEAAVQDKENWLTGIFRNVDGMRDFLNRMGWTILEATEGAGFISADHPVNLQTPAGDSVLGDAGIAWPNIQLHFPVSPRFCLYGSYEMLAVHWIPLSYQGVQDVNRRLLADAVEEVYSSSKRGAQQAYEEWKKVKRRPQ